VDGLAQRGQAGALAGDFGIDRRALARQGKILRGAQRHVQGGAPFAGIDRPAVEHGGQGAGDIAGSSQIVQAVERRGIETLLGKIEQHAGVGEGKARKALRIGGEQLAQVHALQGTGMGEQGVARGGRGKGGHGGLAQSFKRRPARRCAGADRSR
jgi:hypothetical protein